MILASGEGIFGERRPADNADQADRKRIEEARSFRETTGLDRFDRQIAPPEPRKDKSFPPEDIEAQLQSAVRDDFAIAEAIKKAIARPANRQ